MTTKTTTYPAGVLYGRPFSKFMDARVWLANAGDEFTIRADGVAFPAVSYAAPIPVSATYSTPRIGDPAADSWDGSGYVSDTVFPFAGAPFRGYWNQWCIVASWEACCRRMFDAAAKPERPALASDLGVLETALEVAEQAVIDAANLWVSTVWADAVTESPTDIYPPHPSIPLPATGGFTLIT